LPAAYQLQAAGKGKEQPKKTAISSAPSVAAPLSLLLSKKEEE
jgi:hypothetical protein